MSFWYGVRSSGFANIDIEKSAEVWRVRGYNLVLIK